jgi:hypothetical protein
MRGISMDCRTGRTVIEVQASPGPTLIIHSQICCSTNLVGCQRDHGISNFPELLQRSQPSHFEERWVQNSYKQTADKRNAV